MRKSEGSNSLFTILDIGDSRSSSTFLTPSHQSEYDVLC